MNDICSLCINNGNEPLPPEEPPNTSWWVLIVLLVTIESIFLVSVAACTPPYAHDKVRGKKYK
jgi:hypothetical protein